MIWFWDRAIDTHDDDGINYMESAAFRHGRKLRGDDTFTARVLMTC